MVGVDYSGWTSGKSFVVGDKLVFRVIRGQHTVTEVNQSDYDSCSIVPYSILGDGQVTTVTLTTPGTHYYICVYHCESDGGMKLAVTVAGGGVTASGASLRVPAMGAVVAAAAGALVKVALF